MVRGEVGGSSGLRLGLFSDGDLLEFLELV
jgi:hypothetical protein